MRLNVAAALKMLLLKSYMQDAYLNNEIIQV